MTTHQPEVAPRIVYEAPPMWIRPPKDGGLCRHFGLSRSAYYRLIKAGTIASVCVRDPGKLKGVRLIKYESVRKYLEGLEE